MCVANRKRIRYWPISGGKMEEDLLGGGLAYYGGKFRFSGFFDSFHALEMLEKLLGIAFY
jgi:hypothetical protein